MPRDDLDDFLEAFDHAGPNARPHTTKPQPSVATEETGSGWAKTLAAASCWAQSGTSYFPVSDVVDQIPAGAYRCMMTNTGPYLEKMKIQIDHLLALPDSATEILLAEFSQFWNLKPSFDKRGFTFKRGMLMWGPPGCLAADTKLRYSTRGPDGKRRTAKIGSIERLYQAFHRVKGNKRGQYQLAAHDSIHFVSSVDDEGRVFRNKVLNVVKSGVKECFLLTTKNGLKIEATADHKFLSRGKYKPLKKLKVGDTVEIHTNTTVNTSTKVEKKERNFIYVKHHPIARIKFAGNGKYKYHVLPKARAMVEADLNGLTLKAYKQRLDEGKLSGLKFLNKSDDVHHMDENCTNDHLDNLQVIDHAEHQRLHGLKDQDLWFVTTEDTVKSIKAVGLKETYDVQMESPYNNFVAANFVVHNSGKTSAVWQMTQRLVKDHDGVVIFVENPQVAIWCLTMLRRIEATRPMITVMEDIDAIIEHQGEHGLLALLDGEFQISNVVHVATTNYPHRLDKRFIDRPSRFDTIMKVGMPSADARFVYFRAKEPDLPMETINRWVDLTEGYSVAHLREVCIATQCFNQPEEAVFGRLDKMRQVLVLDETGSEERQEAGFLSRMKKQRG